MINTLTYANTKYTYHGSSSLCFSTINSIIRQVTHWVHTETRDTSRRLVRQVRTVGRSEMIHAKLLLLLLLRNLMLLRDLRLLLLLLLRNLGLLLLLLLRGLLRSLLLLRLLLLLLRDSSSWLLVSRLLLLLEIGSLTKSVIVDISGGGISGCGGGSGGCGSGCGSGSSSGSSSFGNSIGLCNRLFNNSDSNSGFLDTT